MADRPNDRPNDRPTTDQWLSIKDAAAALGVSEDAIRSKVKRRTLRSRKGNDSRISVLVADRPNDQWPTNGRPMADRPNDRPIATNPDPDLTDLLSRITRLVEGGAETPQAHQRTAEAAIAAVLAAHKEQVELLRADHAHQVGQLRSDHQDKMERLAGWWQEQHQSELDRMHRTHREDAAAAEQRRIAALADRDRQHCESVQMLIERIDSAELRAERLEDLVRTLVDRKPWWSRWVR